MAMAATGIATFGGALAVAGGMMSGLGLLGNDKKMLRLGSIASAVSGMLGTGAAEAGSQTIGDSMTSYGEGIAEGVQGDFGLTGGKSMLTTPPPAAPQALGEVGSGLGADLGSVAQAPGATLKIPTAGLTQTPQSGGLADLLSGPAKAPTSGVYGAMPATNAPTGSLLEQAARGLTQQDITAAAKQQAVKQSLWEQTFGGVKDAAKGLGQFTRENPELVNIASQAIQGAYGPQAEEMDYRRSLYERSRANLNAPVRLKYQPTPGG
jgi:hypothetical protein